MALIQSEILQFTQIIDCVKLIPDLSLFTNVYNWEPKMMSR